MASHQEIKKNNLEFLQRIYDEGHRSIELYHALIDNISKEQAEDLINELATSIVGTEKLEDLNEVLSITHYFLHKYMSSNCDAFHRSFYDLYWSSDVCKSNTRLRLLLAHTQKDVSYLYEDVDDEQRHQLICCINIQKKKYEEAVHQLCKLVNYGDYPTLMEFVALNVDPEPKVAEKMCDLIDNIISNGNQETYREGINIYIKRLFDNKNMDIATKICDKFDDDFIRVFTKADLYVSENDDEKLYKFLSEDLNNIVSFFPTCHWLFKAAVRLNKTQELKKLLIDSGKTNKHILQLIDTLKEYNGEPSRRMYRYTDGIKTKENLDIVFCINNEYFTGFQAAITSLIINNSSILNNLRFHIGVDDSVDLDNLTGFMEILDINYEIHNMQEKYKTDNLKVEYGIKTHYKLDKSAYYRIFMFDKLLRNKRFIDVTRILYLDSDVLVLSSIHELLTMKLTHCLHACLEDQEEVAVARSKDLNDIKDYFNSGVLLIDATEKDIRDRIRKTIKNVHKQENLIMHDQCALNIAFNRAFAFLDPKFNFLIHQNDLNIISENINILHLSGRIKPWHEDYHQDEYIGNLWFTYYNMAKAWIKKTK